MNDLEPWQEEFLNSLRSLPGMKRAETREVVAEMFFAPDDDEEHFHRAWEKLSAHSDPLFVQMRFFEVGRIREFLLSWTERDEHAKPDSERDPFDADVDPTLTAFGQDVLREVARTPNTRRLHAGAQAAVLRAIERLADRADTVDDVRGLADAYMTLPTPGEDDGPG